MKKIVSKRVIASVLSLLMCFGNPSSSIVYAMDQPSVPDTSIEETQTAEEEKETVPETTQTKAETQSTAAETAETKAQEETAAKPAETEAQQKKEETAVAFSYDYKSGNGTEVKINADKGVFPKGTKVSIKPVSKTQAIDALEDAFELAGSTYSVLDAELFDMVFTDENNHTIQPNGKVTITYNNVSLDVEGYEKYVSYHNYRLNADGTVTELEGKTDIAQKTTTFKNDHFTKVGFAAVADLTAVEADAEDQISIAGTNPDQPVLLDNITEIDLKNNISSQSFKVQLADGSYVESTDLPAGTKLHVGDEVWAQFKYNDFTNVDPEQVYYFDIPEGLSPLTTGDASVGILKNTGTGGEIGKFWVEDGKIKLQFDKVEKGDTVTNGYLNFYASLNNDAVTNKGEIKLNGTVIAKLDIEEPTEVTKAGVYKYNGDLFSTYGKGNLCFDANKRLVKYSFQIDTNGNTTVVKDLKVVDTLTTKVDGNPVDITGDYQDISIKVEPFNNSSGPVNTNVNAKFEKGPDGKYVFSAQNVDPNTRISVTYYVPVDAGVVDADFSNTAEVVKNDQIVVPSSDTVTGKIKTTLQINKTAGTPQFDTTTGETKVTYTIKVTAPSSNSADIADAYVVDKFVTNGQLVKKISKVSSTTSGVTGGGSLDGDNSFKVQLGIMKPGQTVTYTYVATLDTKECYFPDKPSEKELKNTAEVKNDKEKFNDSSAVIKFSRENTTKKGAYDATKGLFKYTVTFNGMLPTATDENNADSYYDGPLKSFEDIITTGGFTFAGDPAPHLEAYRGDSVLKETDITKDENGKDIAGQSNVSVPIPENMRGKYSYRLTYYVKAPEGFVYHDGETIKNTFKSTTSGLIGTDNPESEELIFTTDSSTSAAMPTNLNLTKVSVEGLKGVPGEDGYALQSYKLEVTSPITTGAEVKDWATISDGSLVNLTFPLDLLDLNITVGSTALKAGTDYKVEEVNDPAGSFKITFLKDFPQVNDSNNKMTITYKGKVVATDAGIAVGAEANGLKNNTVASKLTNHAELSMGSLTSGEKTAETKPTGSIEKKAGKTLVMGCTDKSNGILWDISFGSRELFGEGSHTLVDELPDYLEVVNVQYYEPGSFSEIDPVGMPGFGYYMKGGYVSQNGSGNSCYWTTEGNKVTIHNADSTRAYRLVTRVKASANLTDQDGNPIDPDNFDNLTVDNTAYYEAVGAKWYASASQQTSLHRSEKSFKYSSDTLTFTVDINKDAADLVDGDTLTIKDTMNKQLSLKTDTLKVTADGKELSASEYELKYTEGSNNFEIVVPDGKHVVITYQTYIDAEVGEAGWLENTAEIEGRGSKVTSENLELKRTEIGGGGAVKPIFYVKKTDESDKLLSGASFTLTKVELQDGKLVETGDAIESIDGGDGTYKLKGNGLDTNAIYVLKETAAPEGYVKDSKVHYIAFKSVSADVKDAIAEDSNATLTEDAHTGGGNKLDTMYKVVNRERPNDIDVSVSKTWDDANNQDGKRPTSEIKVQLYKTVGNTTSTVGDPVALTEKDGKLTYTFTGLPAEEGNQQITYSVKELVEDGSAVVGENLKFNEDYTVAYSGSMENGFVITNTHTPETVEISVEKKWEDAQNQAGFRAGSVTIQLMANGTAVDGKTLTLNENNQWKDSFTGLPAYANGAAITYTVKEMKADGSAVVGDDAKFDAHYTVAYSGSVENGFVVTNTYTPETVDVPVEKKWEDAQDQAGLRSDRVTVQLLANGAPIVGKTLTLDENNQWKDTFTGLPQNAGGAEITYTVKEMKADGSAVVGDDAKFDAHYTVAYSGTMTDGLIVTNKYEPETVDIPVEKKWEDAQDQAGFRAASVTIQLMADDVAVDGKTLILNENNQWKDSFTGLPVYANGAAITYTVKEMKADGSAVVGDDMKFDAHYTVAYSGSVENGFVVKNMYTPETVDVPVEKKWEDAQDQAGFRAGSVTIQLMADDVAVNGKTLTLNENNQWKDSFTGLPAYANGAAITYTVKEMKADGSAVVGDGKKFDEHYTVSYSYYEAEDPADNCHIVTNTYEPETVDIPVEKTWNDADNQDGQRPAQIHVKVMNENTVVKEADITGTGNTWSYTFTGLPKYADGQEIDYTVVEDGVAGYQTTYTYDDGCKITNSYTPGKTSVTVTKKWEDAGNQDGYRADSVVIQLMADGAAVDGKTLTLNADNNWQDTFTDLPEKSNKKTIVYSVKEMKADGSAVVGDDAKFDEHYTVAYSGAMKDGFTVTNTHTPETVDVPVEKKWEDAQDQAGFRAGSVTIQLMADDVAVDGKTLTLNENNQWKDSFTGLPAYANGAAITYTVKEMKADGSAVVGDDAKFDEYYTVAYSGTMKDGFTVTNTYEPETVDIPVEKTWNDADNQDGQRPAQIHVKVMNENTVVKEADITGTGNTWTYTFTGLPKYADGQEIDYTVVEDGVAGYQTTYTYDDGCKITNSYTPGKTSVTVIKKWEDAGNQDGYRADSVVIQLMADGAAVDGKTLTLNADNNWQDTFTDLPEKSNKKTIVYSVKEMKADGSAVVGDDAQFDEHYTVSYSGTMKDGFVVTNTHTPETVDVPVTKTWNDADNQDGKRPEQIHVKVMNGNEVAAEADIVGRGNEWSYTFTGLPRYANGLEITYNVIEDAVPEYQTTYDRYHIINAYTPGETSVTVTKNWDDANNQDGFRKDVTIQLMADYNDGNGVTAVAGQTLTLNADNNWKDTFTNLPEMKDQKVIAYSVKEMKADGSDVVGDDAQFDEHYTVSYSGTMKDGFVVTNTHTPETVEIPVTKKWEDADNQDGIRPEKIHVKVMNGDAVAAETDLTGEGNEWSYTFKDLPKYADGQEIDYTVVEDAVDGYETAYDGAMITNTHTPATIEIPVTKTWDDADDQDGKRPEQIHVKVMNGDAVAAEADLTGEGNEWSYTFKDLPKYENGQEIKYNVIEDAVKDYKTTYDGNHITNSYTPGKTSVTVIKNWDDQDNQDGFRKEVQIQLMADYNDGKGVVEVKDQIVTLNEDNQWKAAFTDLPEKSNKKTITYSVKEMKADGKTVVGEDMKFDENYSVSYSGDMKGGFVVTNKHQVLKTSVMVHKVWEDRDNKEGKRDLYKNGITLNLIADGKVVETVSMKPDQNGNWSYEFTDLDQKKDGKDIVYTVTEVQTDAERVVYEATVEGSQTKGFTITNSEITRKVAISKQTENKKELAGAKLEILDQDAKTIAAWTTTGKLYELELRPGKYTLREKAAPAGYVLAQDIHFVVNNDGTVTIGNSKGAGEDKNVVVMVDKTVAKTSVPTPTSRFVKTGDDANVLLWMSLLICSAAAVLIIVFLARRRKNK